MKGRKQYDFMSQQIELVMQDEVQNIFDILKKNNAWSNLFKIQTQKKPSHSIVKRTLKLDKVVLENVKENNIQK